MLDPKFPLCVKSTLDKIISDIGASLTLPVVDLDSAGLVAELLDSDRPAIVWAIGTLTEDPMDPLWFVDFDVGAKTSLDPAQYKSLDITSSLTNYFRTGTFYTVKDYSGVTAGTVDLGQIIITALASAPSQPDRLSGIRLLNIQARIVRN